MNVLVCVFVCIYCICMNAIGLDEITDKTPSPHFGICICMGIVFVFVCVHSYLHEFDQPSKED